MALRLIQKRYSKFMLDSKIGAIPRNTIHQSTPSRSDLHTFEKRFYFKNREYDNQGPFYFKNTEYDYQRWFHNPKRVCSTLFFFTCGALLGVSSGKSVTVPYSERSHFILFHKFLAKILPEEHTTYEGKLLPHSHPDSITARTIFQDIINQAFPIEMEIKSSLQEKENCQIIVCDDPQDMALNSGRFGKIFVTSGLLDRYRNHEEMIATIFGVEVGNDLARHNQELISKFISLVSGIGMSLYLFCSSSYVRSKMPFLDTFMRRRFLPGFSLVVAVPMLSYLPWAMYHRKMEYEADHIGLMLAASAGYNPVLGLMYPVYREEFDKSVLAECFSILPSGRNRCLYLARPEIYSEAVCRYLQSAEPSGTTDST